jgi:hypothetical protein
VISVDANARGELYSIAFRDGKLDNPVRIRTSNYAPSIVAPLVRGNEVYIGEVQQGRARLRRLQLEW